MLIPSQWQLKQYSNVKTAGNKQVGKLLTIKYIKQNMDDRTRTSDSFSDQSKIFKSAKLKNK